MISKYTSIRIIFLVCVIQFSIKVNSQTKGLIFEPATVEVGQSVLDPNGDGYISSSSTGFTSAVQGTPGNDVPEFENTSEWLSFPTIGSGEVLRDIRSGPDEGFTDFSITNDGTATYYRFDSTNMIFRFRLADYRPNSKGYTVLIDTDSKFGEGKDPDYTSENPGFEVAVVLMNKQDVFVFDVNSGSLWPAPAPIHSYVGGTNHQKSISGIQDDGDLDFFYDFYIPLSDLSIAGIPVDAATKLRLAATTNTSNSYTFGGSLSDVGGVDDNAYAGCLECLFTDLIEPQVPTSPDGGTGFPENRTDCPTIDGSYPVGIINIQGAAVPGASMTFYRNDTLIPEAFVRADAITGAYVSLNITTYKVGDVISVRATDSVSVPILSESDSTCALTTITATPICTGVSPVVLVSTPNASGQSDITTAETASFTLANATNATLRFFSNGVDITGTVAGTGSFGVPTSDGTTITWVFDMFSNEKVPCGTMYVTLEDNDNGLCESTSLNACNEAGSCKAAASAVPIITTAPITTATTSISGTSESGDAISLYIDGIGFANTTAVGTNWTVSPVDLSGYLCRGITATANGSGECASAATDPALTVEQVSTAPTITDASYCGTTSVIYGTSFEADGTTPNEGATITLNVGGTATVRSTGDWSVSGLSLTGGTMVTAVATDPDNCQTVSPASVSITISTPSATPLGTVNTVNMGDAIITGNCTSGASVNVYIDKILLGAAAVAETTWSFTVGADDLYVGGAVMFTESLGGDCESDFSEAIIIPCNPMPDVPSLSYTPVCEDLTNKTVDILVGNVNSGIIYTLVNGDSLDYGITQYSSGTADLTVTSLALLDDPSKLLVKADEFNPGTNCVSISAPVVINLNPHRTITSSTNTPASCADYDGTITVSGLANSTNYSLNYRRNGVVPVGAPFSVTSTGTGDYVIAGLSNATYTDIEFTANSCTSPPLSETLSGTGSTVTSLAIVANPSSVGSGNASTIEIGGITNASYTYELYNKETKTIIGSALGNGGILSISTGNLTAETTFYVVVDEGGGNCVTLATEPTVTIAAAALEITINDPTAVTEGNAGTTILTYRITLSGTSASDVTVDWSTADGTATAGSDYVAVATTTATITAGSTYVDVEVTVNGDVILEGDETILVNLTNPSGATITDAQGEGTITDDEAGLTLSINDPTAVTEGNAGTTILTYRITLSGTSASDVTVDWSTADGTATAGSDYVAVATTTATIAAGSTYVDVEVTVNGDVILEGDETILVNLTNPSGATITDAQGEGTITDDEAGLTLSINDPTAVTEGNAGTTILTYRITLSGTSASDVTVDWTTAEGTATAGSDYVAVATTTATIAAGSTFVDVEVTVNGDVILEGDETILINLTNPSGATITDAQGEGTITDDEAGLTLSINDPAAVTEGNAGTTILTYRITLSGTSASDVTVDWTTADGTATAGSDYVAVANTTATIAAGNTYVDVEVTVNGDVILEGDETILVNLTTPSGATITDAQGEGTITDDEGIPTVILSANPLFIDENGGISTLTATLNHASVNDVIVTLDFSGTALGSDYTIVSTTITILAGDLSGTTTVTSVNDFDYEGVETVIASISGVTNAIEVGIQQETITITDDDPAPPVNQAPLAVADNVTIIEGSSATGDLLANDSDPDGDNITINTTTVSGPSNGTVVINPDGTYSYTPLAGYTGSDSFVYEVCDDGTPSECATATVSITISAAAPVNRAPVAANDLATISEGGTASSNLLANDSDPDGDNLTINTTVVSGPSNGTVVINPDGTYSYTPVAGYTGSDSFVYEVCDDGTPSECATATVSITISAAAPVNRAPVAANDLATISEGGTASGNLLANDSDPDGDNLTINTTAVSGPSNGVVTINTDGTYSYTPNAGYTGTDSFVYQVCDDGTPSECITATVAIVIESNDTDGDGIPNDVEGDNDTDGDGIPDSEDTDSDGDGILDEDEGAIDSDNDGTPDYIDSDSDNDGILDEDENTGDTDNDGIPDYLDMDSDNDGIDDNDESDGDCDNDGISDRYDSDNCNEALFIPQGFSPNGDGDNDYFIINRLVQYNHVSIEIYNRWGNVIYKQDNYENDWDGTSNVNMSIGDELPAGTYFYKLTIHDTDETINGYVYLNR